MSNYGALADRLKGTWQPAIPAAMGGVGGGSNMTAFFDRVKLEILEEAKSANVELRGRGLATIDQVFVPCYRGKLCLTFGTTLLCVVDLDQVKARITAVILGPPNREEISRRDYLIGRNFANRNHPSTGSAAIHAVEDNSGRIASQIVSELLETGIRLTQKRAQTFEKTEKAWTAINESAALAEYWVSLGSLLRSYTAVHGMSDNREAIIDLNEESISVRHGAKWLRLERNNARVTWTRENGSGGLLEFTGHGELRGPDGEEAMDLAAEAWARGLMYDNAMEPAQ